MPSKSYLFFLAFFFAGILFSSQVFKYPPITIGGARYQFQCIVTVESNVKQKVIAKMKSFLDYLCLYLRAARRIDVVASDLDAIRA